MFSAAACLKSLHPDLKSFLYDLSEKQSKLIIKIKGKQNSLDKWCNDETCFSRSVQFKFEHASISDIMMHTAFKSLQEQCEKIIFICKTDLKEHMADLLNVEQELIYSQARGSLATIIFHTIKSVIMNTRNLKPISHGTIHRMTAEIARSSPDLLSHVDTGCNAFFLLYEQVHSVHLGSIDNTNNARDLTYTAVNMVTETLATGTDAPPPPPPLPSPLADRVPRPAPINVIYQNRVF